MDVTPLPEGRTPDIDASPSAALVPQREAARYLGVSLFKVGWLITHQHLTGSRHGVTADSLRKEKQWRDTASRGQKTKRILTDTFGPIFDGL